MHHEEGSSKAFYVLIGAMTGAGIALLLAPKSGRETRESIKAYGSDFTSWAGDFEDDLRQRLDHYLDELENYTNQGAGRGEEYLNRAIRGLEETRRRLNDRIERYRARMKPADVKATTTPTT